MSQNTDLIEILKKEIKEFGSLFKEAAEKAVDANVSEYPLFVAHRQDVLLGIPFIEHQKSGTFWSYNLTTLEELVTKNIVLDEKVKDFKKVYRNPLEAICLFVIEEQGAGFVFYPYQ